MLVGSQSRVIQIAFVNAISPLLVAVVAFIGISVIQGSLLGSLVVIAAIATCIALVSSWQARRMQSSSVVPSEESDSIDKGQEFQDLSAIAESTLGLQQSGPLDKHAMEELGHQEYGNVEIGRQEEEGGADGRHDEGEEEQIEVSTASDIFAAEVFQRFLEQDVELPSSAGSSEMNQFQGDGLTPCSSVIEDGGESISSRRAATTEQATELATERPDSPEQLERNPTFVSQTEAAEAAEDAVLQSVLRLAVQKDNSQSLNSEDQRSYDEPPLDENDDDDNILF